MKVDCAAGDAASGQGTLTIAATVTAVPTSRPTDPTHAPTSTVAPTAPGYVFNSTAELYYAVDQWFEDEANATAAFGPMSRWDTRNAGRRRGHRTLRSFLEERRGRHDGFARR